MASSLSARSLWALRLGSFYDNKPSRPSSGIFDAILPLDLAPLTRRAAVSSGVNGGRKSLRLWRGRSSLRQEGAAPNWIPVP
jgi:hypothetical protein